MLSVHRGSMWPREIAIYEDRWDFPFHPAVEGFVFFRYDVKSPTNFHHPSFLEETSSTLKLACGQ